MAMRCFSPPDSSEGRWFMRSASPTSVSASTAIRRASSGVRPWYFSTVATCCTAVSALNRLKPWKMKPQWSNRNRSSRPDGRSHRLWPSARTSPASGFSSPDSAATSVDLPEPDGPMTMVTSPWRASKFTPLSTSIYVRPVLNRLLRPLATRAGVPGA